LCLTGKRGRFMRMAANRTEQTLVLTGQRDGAPGVGKAARRQQDAAHTLAPGTVKHVAPIRVKRLILEVRVGIKPVRNSHVS